MEKLTQFVSKSFENNNNTSVSEQCLNLTSIKTSSSPSIKMEDDCQQDDPKRPKNWLISDLQKNNSAANFGIDLRLNYSSSEGGNEKWFETNEKSPSPKNSYSSSSPIDLEDSKSCPETVASEKNDEDNNKQENVDKDERKLCELYQPTQNQSKT